MIHSETKQKYNFVKLQLCMVVVVVVALVVEMVLTLVVEMARGVGG